MLGNLAPPLSKIHFPHEKFLHGKILPRNSLPHPYHLPRQKSLFWKHITFPETYILPNNQSIYIKISCLSVCLSTDVMFVCRLMSCLSTDVSISIYIKISCLCVDLWIRWRHVCPHMTSELFHTNTKEEKN